jgi:phosphoadenosine phosphosulfate reductase
MRGLAPAPTEIPGLEELSAQEVLAEAVERFSPRLYVASSFQKEASIVMDMLLKIDPNARFFTLDTGFLFPETYATWKALEQRYGIEIDVYQGPSPARQAELHGEELWTHDPDKCCEIRKVVPMREALAQADAWITGVRREHSPGRVDVPKLGWDAKNGLYKVAPLADWTEKDAWRYIFENDVPYNPLHDQGYESIGCVQCTKPGAGREGRWAGTDKEECGIHT